MSACPECGREPPPPEFLARFYRYWDALIAPSARKPYEPCGACRGQRGGACTCPSKFTTAAKETP